MPTDVLYARDSDVIALQTAVREGGFGLTTAPEMIVRVLESEAWKERIVKMTRERVAFGAFEEFVRSAFPDGLGSDVDTIVRLCRDHALALSLIDKALQQGHGQHGPPKRNVDNINVSRGRATGTARRQALRYLRQNAAALHDRVVAGELSAHAAMVAAGKRKPTVTIRLNAESFARAARKHLSDDDRRRLVALLEAPA